MDEEFDFKSQQQTADGALASLEAMAGDLKIEAHERHLHNHLNSILDDRHKGVHGTATHGNSWLGTSECRVKVFRSLCGMSVEAHAP